MSKRLITLLAVAFLVAGVACAAYAEVQNVKVSGDITVLGVARNHFDLTNGPAGDKNSVNESFIGTQTRVRIDADLTDNVMTTIRLINERAWTGESVQSSDIDLDLAFVTLKEFLYSPMSVTIGRQELKYGNQLIIGAANTYAAAVANNIPTDLGMRSAFDAIKVVLNYDPLVIDTFYAKIDEGQFSGLPPADENDDTNLWGVNAAYSINKDTKVESYLFSRTASSSDKTDKIYTLGAIVSNKYKDITASIEGAFQFGYNNASATQTRRRAYAFQAMADVSLPFEKTKKYAPMVGIGWTYLSGDKDSNDNKLKSWNSMYYNQALNNITYAIFPFTNLSVLNVKASVKPMEDITLMAKYGAYYQAQKGATSATSNKRDAQGNTYSTSLNADEKFVGNALDLTAVYDYTEDVQIGVTAGMFAPGKAVNSPKRDATQLIGSMKVTF